MKKAMLLALAALIAAVIPASVAHAKGAREITISGPGMAPVTLHGEGHTGTFATFSGFWGQAFLTTPDPTTDKTTATELGPKYEASYLMAAPGVRKSTVVQEIYPYAKPQPQTYIAPDQLVMGGRTKGGWYTAGPELLRFLTARGLPSAAGAGSASASSSPLKGVAGTTVPPAGGGSWWLWVLGGFVLCTFAAGALARVRRIRSLRTVT